MTVRAIAMAGMYFLVYEQAQGFGSQHGWSPVPLTIAAGGTAGCVSLAMVHPVDVVKSRVQSLPVDAPPGERTAMSVAWRGLAREGGAFFLKGFSAAMQRAFVVNAATFGGYELVMSALRRRG